MHKMAQWHSHDIITLLLVLITKKLIKLQYSALLTFTLSDLSCWHCSTAMNNSTAMWHLVFMCILHCTVVVKRMYDAKVQKHLVNDLQNKTIRFLDSIPYNLQSRYDLRLSDTYVMETIAVKAASMGGKNVTQFV